MAWVLLWLSFLTTGVGLARCNVGGPPTSVPSVCNNVMPSNPPAPHVMQTGNGDYFISTDILFGNGTGFYNYTADQTYTVQVQSQSVDFRGFLVQAWDPSETRIGKFVTRNSQQQLINCNTVNSAIPSEATIAHLNPMGVRSSETFNWIAPSTDGQVNFIYSVVRSQPQYFGALSAAAQTQQPLVPEVIVTSPPDTGIPATVTDPTRDPEDYRITARFPTDCIVSECSIFVGIDTNAGESTYLDVYMEGTAQAWVAVGFTLTPNMFGADVLGCNVDPSNNMIQALDTWNDQSQRSNVVDGVQSTGLRSGSFTNGRIQCTMVREIAGSEIGVRDFNLDGSYFLLYGVGINQGAGSLRIHETGTIGNPQVSNEMVNPASGQARFGGNLDDVRNGLTRAHGIFMWVAWTVLASTGIFFAAWMRPALPMGKWFQVHRALMVISLFVGAIGFFFIFVAQYNRPTKGLITLGSDNIAGTVHFVFGIVVMLLHIVNPLISLCRCHPGTANRWIFNLIHGYGIGLFVQTLALVNVGIGIGIFNESFSFAPGLNFFYLFIVYLIFFSIMNIVLYVVFYFTSKKESDEKEKKEIELKGGPPDPDKTDEKPPTPPSKDSPIRWAAFVVYATVLCLVTIIMVILIAL